MKLKYKGNGPVMAAGQEMHPGDVAEFPDQVGRCLLHSEDFRRVYDQKKKANGRTRSAGGE